MTCPADVKSEEKRSPNGVSGQQSEPEHSYLDALNRIAAAVERNNHLLDQLTTQNQVLLERMLDPDEAEEPDEPMEYMDGTPRG